MSCEGYKLLEGGVRLWDSAKRSFDEILDIDTRCARILQAVCFEQVIHTILWTAAL